MNWIQFTVLNEFLFLIRNSFNGIDLNFKGNSIYKKDAKVNQNRDHVISLKINIENNILRIPTY